MELRHPDIRDLERDHRQAFLNSADWARSTDLEGWAVVEGEDALSRTVASGSRPDGTEGEVREYMLRLPSSPLVKVNRLNEHPLSLASKAPMFHTYRLLMADGSPTQDQPITKVFILHNGLDERDDLTFHHEFAARVVLSDSSQRTACIIRPFPGHLTRYPFSSPFAQTPLDRYLDDAGDLFRQFLRSMTEARWLLSILAPLDRYNSPTGADLLGSIDGRRESEEYLAADLVQEWRSIWNSSRDGEAEPIRNLDSGAVEACVKTLRNLLGHKVISSSGVASTLAEIEPVRDAAIKTADRMKRERSSIMAAADELDAPPSIHVVGYSLGGFVAQSVFSLYPFLVSGCSTILSGGALRSVTPTAFAHPEEWQTVLHALRYELDDMMLKRRMRFVGDTKDDWRFDEAHELLGMRSLVTDAFVRVFYEVFQQEYAPSYRSRLAELGRRMLFVVGGADEIVRAQSVIDAAPPEGINLIEIANLSHFLGKAAQEPAERDQRDYWLPEVARIVGRFAGHAESLRAIDLRTSWLRQDLSRPALRSSIVLTGSLLCGAGAVAPAVRVDGVLPSPDFERYLDFLVAATSNEHRHDLLLPGKSAQGSGRLYILQNWIPSVILDDEGMRERAAALHHADGEVSRYLVGLRRRSKILEKNVSKVTFVVQKKAAGWHHTRDRRHPSRSESIPGVLREATQARSSWPVPDVWLPSVMEFDPENAYGAGVLSADASSRLSMTANSLLPTLRGRPGAAEAVVATLPNIWLWADERFRYGPDDLIDVCVRFTERQAPGSSGSAQEPPGLRPISVDDVDDLLRNDKLRILKLSGSVYNPRFRGRLVTRSHEAHALLVHTALAISAATRRTE